MKHLILALLLILSFHVSHAEEKEGLPMIGIAEALALAIAAVPSGAEITSIERFEICSSKYAFYAVYGEKAVSYTRREKGPDGNYIEIEKSIKRKIGVEVSMTGQTKSEVLINERTKPEREDGARPRRRVILNKN